MLLQYSWMQACSLEASKTFKIGSTWHAFKLQCQTTLTHTVMLISTLKAYLLIYASVVVYDVLNLSNHHSTHASVNIWMTFEVLRNPVQKTNKNNVSKHGTPQAPRIQFTIRYHHAYKSFKMLFYDSHIEILTGCLPKKHIFFSQPKHNKHSWEYWFTVNFV